MFKIACMKKIFVLAVLYFLSTSGLLRAQPTNLRCEFMANPIGIDVTTLQFNWELVIAEKESLAAGYRLMVATSPELLIKQMPDLFDSGIKENASHGLTINIP